MEVDEVEQEVESHNFGSVVTFPVKPKIDKERFVFN
jgi:hypothetical protein